VGFVGSVGFVGLQVIVSVFILQLGLSHRSQLVDGQVGVHFASGLLLQL